MRSRSRARRRGAAGILAVLVVLVGMGGILGACARNPATGELQLSFIGRQQEIEMGREADRSIVETMGVYPDDSLQTYVAGLGQEMAAVTERPDLPWSFRVVDEPVVNAFALPGGFVYLTRGILAHFNTEAQLAAVLGHEIGHVTARHSVNQMSRQQLAGLGLGIGSILSPEVAQFRGVISAGMQLAFLRFSRDDERQSDDLGLRYMTEVGYDPREMPDVFRMLGRASGGGENRIPEWLSTHPDPENREERIRDQIASLEAAPDTLRVGREAYLRRIDGLVFGDDPRNGFFRGSTFLHPGLRFRFDVPAGWRTVNQARRVAAQPEEGGAVVELSLAEGDAPGAALRAFLDEEGIQAGPTELRPVNGLEAAWGRFAVRTEQVQLGGLVVFVSHRGTLFRLLGYTARDRYGAFRERFEEAFLSFDELDDPDVLDVEPRRITLVELPRAMSLAELQEERPSTVGVEQLAVLNQVEADEILEAGRLVKRITGEGVPDGP